MYGGDGKNGESIKVLVRVRPLTDEQEENERGSEGVVDILGDSKLSISNAEGNRTFQCSFDHVLSPDTDQERVYGMVQACTGSVLDGFNSTIFAYGQTGSGKTHTMFGPPSGQNERGASMLGMETSKRGVIPRAIEEIFSLSKNMDVINLSVYCSFVQIYNEDLFDMLRDRSMQTPLSIREDKGEIYVQGLSEYNVKSVSDTLQLLRVAEENRAIRETHMNQFSSRSHSIFQIYVEQKRVAEDGGELTLRAKFNLVDLAGSEKWNTKKEMMDEHIAEMTNINLSLHTLGKCITSLAHKAAGRDSHVPYRESKLTRLLQDALGGNARTYLIATISPSRHNAHESISTLKFADRAKQVMVQAVINESRPVDHELVQRLQREVNHLRTMLQQVTIHMEGAGAQAPAQGMLSGAMSPSATAMSGRLSPGGTTPMMDLSIVTGTGMAASAGPAALLLQLEKALMQEKERVLALEKENKELKGELSQYKDKAGRSQSGRKTSAGRVVSARPQTGKRSETPVSTTVIKGVIFDKGRISDIKDAMSTLNNIREQNGVLWQSLEQLQTVMQEFFGFVIEEDALKERLREIFEYLGPVATSNPPVELTKQVNSAHAMLLALSEEASKTSTTTTSTSRVPSPSRDLLDDVGRTTLTPSMQHMLSRGSSPTIVRGPITEDSSGASSPTSPKSLSPTQQLRSSPNRQMYGSNLNQNVSQSMDHSTAESSKPKGVRIQTKPVSASARQSPTMVMGSNGDESSGRVKASSPKKQQESPSSDQDKTKTRPDTHSSVLSNARPIHSAIPAPPASAGPNPYPVGGSPHAHDVAAQKNSHSAHENAYAVQALSQARNILGSPPSIMSVPPSPSGMVMAASPVGYPLTQNYQAQFQTAPLQAIQSAQQQQQLMLQQQLLSQQLQQLSIGGPMVQPGMQAGIQAGVGMPYTGESQAPITIGMALQQHQQQQAAYQQQIAAQQAVAQRAARQADLQAEARMAHAREQMQYVPQNSGSGKPKKSKSNKKLEPVGAFGAGSHGVQSGQHVLPAISDYKDRSTFTTNNPLPSKVNAANVPTIGSAGAVDPQGKALPSVPRGKKPTIGGVGSSKHSGRQLTGPEKVGASPVKQKSPKKSSGPGRSSEPAALSFRVRGSQDSAVSEWQQPPTEEDEEEELRRELKKAQKKMKKQEEKEERSIFLDRVE